MKRILLLVLVTAGLLLGACGAPSPTPATQSETESYLGHVDTVIHDALEVALERASLYETALQLDSSEVIQRSADYSKEYGYLLLWFGRLEYPDECSKLRGHVIDFLTYSKEEVTEFGAAFSTGDVEHIRKSESCYNEAQEALELAVAEWDKLEKDWK